MGEVDTYDRTCLLLQDEGWAAATGKKVPEWAAVAVLAPYLRKGGELELKGPSIGVWQSVDGEKNGAQQGDRIGQGKVQELEQLHVRAIASGEEETSTALLRSLRRSAGEDLGEIPLGHAHRYQGACSVLQGLRNVAVRTCTSASSTGLQSRGGTLSCRGRKAGEDKWRRERHAAKKKEKDMQRQKGGG